MRTAQKVLFLTAATALVGATACNKPSAASEEDAGTASTAGTVAVDSNPIAASYPDGLAVTAFAATDDASVAASTVTSGTVAIDYSGASLNLANTPAPAPSNSPPPPVPGGTQPQMQCFDSYEDALTENGQDERKLPPPPPPPTEQINEARERISGKAESCVSEELKSSLSTMAELVGTAGQNLDGYGDCFLPDWGIVQGYFPKADGTSSGDVCMVGYVRNELRKLSAYVDFTKGLSEAMLCQALKDGVITGELEAGSELDLTESLKKALAGLVPLKVAKISRTVGDTPEYVTELTVTKDTKTPSGTKQLDLHFGISHRPSDEENTAYTGIVRVKHPAPGGQITDGVYVLSLNYGRSVDATGNRVKYEMRSGIMAPGVEPFGADGLVDLNAHGKTVSNEKINSMNFVSYDGYPAFDVAKVSYWVNFGGMYSESARGMVFDVKRVDGQVKGCAVAGATTVDLANGLSIRRSIAEGYALLPVGYLRPFHCDNSGTKMWLQCFYRNADGNFVPDPDLITDVASGYDFVASSVVESKAPSLADVPRPPSFDPAKALPPPGAPQGANMPPPPPSLPPPPQ